MEGYRIGDGKAGEGGDLVDDAVGIVRGRVTRRIVFGFMRRRTLGMETRSRSRL
jgi:hypothetical protein